MVEENKSANLVVVSKEKTKRRKRKWYYKDIILEKLIL
jgi:hypothetical protein